MRVFVKSEFVLNLICNVMRRIITILSLTLALFAFSGEAYAQRTMYGQFFVEATGFVGLPISQNVYGGDISVGQYFTSFYWYGGVKFNPPVRRGFGCATVNAGAMYRLLSTRSRVFSAYVGGGLLVGVDYNDSSAAVNDIFDDSNSSSSSSSSSVKEGEEGSIFTPEELYGKSSTGFVYGLEPKVTFEVFPFNKFGFVFGVSAPIKFKTQQSRVSAHPFVGLRYCF